MNIQTIIIAVIILIILAIVVYDMKRNKNRTKEFLIKQEKERKEHSGIIKLARERAKKSGDFQEDIGKGIQIDEEETFFSEKDWHTVLHIASLSRDSIKNSKNSEEERQHKNSFGMMMIAMRENGKLKNLDKDSYEALVKWGAHLIRTIKLYEIYDNNKTDRYLEHLDSEKNAANKNKETIVKDNKENSNDNASKCKLLFKELKGIDFNKIGYNSFDNKNMQSFIESDTDGNWHFASGQMIMIIKNFSINNFNLALDELLNKNKIDRKDLKKKGDIDYWEGNGFDIETPGIMNGTKLIIITNENISRSDTLGFKETDLTNKKHDLNWIKGIKIFDGSNVLKKDRTLLQAINVPLFFNEDESEYILIPVTTLTVAKKLIDEIIKNNGGKNNCKEASFEGWNYLHNCNNFSIGYLPKVMMIRINKITVEDTETSNINEFDPYWIDLVNKRANSMPLNSDATKLSIGMSLEELAQDHANEYKSNEYRIPDDNRIGVAKDRLDGFYSIQGHLQKTGTKEQNFHLEASLKGAMIYASSLNINIDNYDI